MSYDPIEKQGIFNLPNRGTQDQPEFTVAQSSYDESDLAITLT